MDNNTKKSLIEKFAHDSHKKDGFTGAWLYAEKGEIISSGAIGFCDAEDTQPIREDTIFQLASISKNFTAAAVMLVIRKGLLSLDDDITEFFPEIP